jgi:hypothetical protein
VKDPSLDVGLAAAVTGDARHGCQITTATIVHKRLTIIVGTMMIMMLKPGTDGIAETVKKPEMILPAWLLSLTPSFAKNTFMRSLQTKKIILDLELDYSYAKPRESYLGRFYGS